jgi:hypothetical protein
MDCHEKSPFDRSSGKLIDRSISFYHGKARAILIDARAESNLEEGELCPKARKRKLWIINAT